MKAKREETLKYFVDQYKAMLEENLDDYIEHFNKYMRPAGEASLVVQPERQRHGTWPVRRCLPIMRRTGQAPYRRRPVNSARPRNHRP